MKADIRISDRMFCANEVDRDGDLEITIENDNGEADGYLWLSREEQDNLYDVLHRVRLNRGDYR